MKRKILFAIVILVAVAFVLSSCAYKEMKRVREMPINEVDLSNIQGGSYKGDFSYGGFTYEVEVTVKEHRIENIAILKNRDSKHAKKAEGVVEKVLNAQSLEVDAVTGATTTSKALLKAIENALKKGVPQ
jgi:uncharacterized protein with FMN-binding domain